MFFKSVFATAITLLAGAHLSFAGQLEEYGLGLSAAEMSAQGYRSKIRDEFQVFEKKSDTTRYKVIAVKNDYVSYVVHDQDLNMINHVKVNAEGKALSQTQCIYDSPSKKFECHAQTSEYCHELFQKMDQGAFAKKMEHIKECNSLLSTLNYDSVGIGDAQNKAIHTFQMNFGFPATAFVVGAPHKVTSLELLLNDFAACKNMKDKWAQTKKSTPGSSTTKEKTKTGQQ